MKPVIRLLATALSTVAIAAHAAGALEKTECIAPAKPGGGFDLTCKLVQSALQEDKPGSTQRASRPHHNPYEGKQA